MMYSFWLGDWLEGTKKGKATLPGPKEAAGPHGYRTSPCQYVPVPFRSTRVARTRKTALLLPVGQGQGDGDASFGLGNFRINDSARLVKRRAKHGRDGGRGRTQRKGRVNGSGHKAPHRFSQGAFSEIEKAGS